MNTKSYKYSHQKENYGIEYDKKLYSKDCYDNRAWSIEKDILTKYFLKEDISNKNVLDFACGTGRITELLEEFDFKTITGIDVSDSMLKVAKSKLNKTKLLKYDINEKCDNKILDNNFSYITAFRFFLNAEQSLREKTIKSFYKILDEDGIVIANIHLSSKSFMYFYAVFYNFMVNISKILGIKRFRTRNYISENQLVSMFVKEGFELVKIEHYSFMPPFFAKVLSMNKWLCLENYLRSRNLKFSNYFMCFFKKVNG
ncbi:MAG TPA: methyltransferase domain-containing protein [Candidatus Woesebacteria bacterium]|nr:methyltransferase domain-containing protein [Candidatus Woesebacteria bacterium]